MTNPTRKGPTMPSTIETDCREFARQYPLPNVLAAIGHAEAGRITWADAYTLFVQALTRATAAADAEVGYRAEATR